MIEANILEPKSDNVSTKKITICGERVRCRVLLKDKLPKIFNINEKSEYPESAYGNMFSIGLTDSKKEMFTSNMGNGHIFITGTSGFGKTHLLCNIITQAYFKGMPVIVIGINNGIKKLFEENIAENIFGNSYQVYNLKTKTKDKCIPINPFIRYENETETETIERIVSLLSVKSLGNNQEKELKNAIEKSVSKDKEAAAECGIAPSTFFNKSRQFEKSAFGIVSDL